MHFIYTPLQIQINKRRLWFSSFRVAENIEPVLYILTIYNEMENKANISNNIFCGAANKNANLNFYS
jgi:hypothetical protein